MFAAGGFAFGLDDRAYACLCFAFGALGLSGAVGYHVFLGQRVVGNVLALDLVESAFYPGTNEKLGFFLAGVVFNAFPFTFDVVVRAFTFLFEACQTIGTARGDAFLEAVGVLRDDQPVGPDLHGSLGQNDVALEDLLLLDVVNADAVGFEIDRFLAVGLFSVGWHGEGGEQGGGGEAEGFGRHGIYFLADLLSSEATACDSRT